MGLMDKIKNILFEEETVEIPIITKEEYPPKEKEEVKEEIKKEEKKVKEYHKPEPEEDFTINKRFSPNNNRTTYEKEYNNMNSDNNRFHKNENRYNDYREEPKEEKKKEVKESPFLSFDEDEFEMLNSTYHNNVKKDNERRKEETRNQNRRDAVLYSKSTSRETEPPKKFRPSPVISPVYGILDKNYRKDDFLPTSSSEGTLPKIMDVESVRKKAFGTLEEEIENKLKEKEEDIDKNKTIGELIEEDIKNSIEEEEIPHYKTEEIKITNFLDEDEESIDDAIDNSVEDEASPLEEEVSLKEPEIVEEPEEELKEEVPLEETPKEDENSESTDLNKEENVGDTTLESDLFDLIDSMYEKEEE